MAHCKTLDVLTVDSFGEQLDISHLCHTKLCIHPLHLTLEKTLRKFVQESPLESWSMLNGAWAGLYILTVESLPMHTN